jgi:hypothetical protein
VGFHQRLIMADLVGMAQDLAPADLQKIVQLRNCVPRMLLTR